MNQTKPEKVIVTRHPALVDLLIEKGLVDKGTPVLDHASHADVSGKDVFGILPLHLAAAANTVTEIPMRMTRDMRGAELTLDEIREIAEEPRTYKVTVLSR